MRFVANFRYHLDPQLENTESSPFVAGAQVLENLSDALLEKKFNSECDMTMVGFVQQYTTGASFIGPQNQQFLDQGELAQSTTGK